MKLFSKKPSFTKKQLRNSKPRRNPALVFEQSESGEITLHIPIKHSRAPLRLLAKVSGGNAERLVELEPIGAIVWQLCDGAHTVNSISHELQTRFGLTKLEAEASLLAFLETLSKRRFISLEVPNK